MFCGKTAKAGGSIAPARMFLSGFPDGGHAVHVPPVVACFRGLAVFVDGRPDAAPAVPFRFRTDVGEVACQEQTAVFGYGQGILLNDLHAYGNDDVARGIAVVKGALADKFQAVVKFDGRERLLITECGCVDAAQGSGQFDRGEFAARDPVIAPERIFADVF